MGWGVLEFGEEVREFGGEVCSNFGRFHDLNMNNPQVMAECWIFEDILN